MCQLLKAYAHSYNKNYEQAKKILLNSCKDDKFFSTYLLGRMHRLGHGTENNKPDYSQAISLFDVAIEQGNTDAMVERAEMYCIGQGTELNRPNYTGAIAQLNRAIERGNTNAMDARAWMYISGLGTENNRPNYIKAKALLDKAIKLGSTNAMSILAYMYQTGEGVENNQPDYEKAILLLDEAIMHGSRSAMTSRAEMYISRENLENGGPDFAKAIELLNSAIECMSSEAMVERAKMYLNGQGTEDNRPDYAKAILLLNKAIEHRSVEAMYVRARMYRDGNGVENTIPDYHNAILLLEQCIEQRYPEAMYTLAHMYIKGIGTVGNRPDYEKAEQLFNSAAPHGHISSMLALADLSIQSKQPTRYADAMRQILNALDKDPSSSEKIAIEQRLAQLSTLQFNEASHFLFNNLYRFNGVFSQNKNEAMTLFHKQPSNYFIEFCKDCIQEIRTLSYDEDSYQRQLEQINELVDHIPMDKKTPAVTASINRYMGYAKFLILGELEDAYQHFRNIPQDYLTEDDFSTLADMMHIIASDSDDPTNTNLLMAQRFAECDMEAANKKRKISYDTDQHRILSTLVLNKSSFFERSYHAFDSQERLKLHAKPQPLSRHLQQMNLLKEYQLYLSLKTKFEPTRVSSSLFFSAYSLQNSTLPADTESVITSMINALDKGIELNTLLELKETKLARINNQSFNELIEKLLELPFLPELTAC